jgi:hypothetical protein
MRIDLNESAVKAVRKYYHFLANNLGAIPPECIVEPPEGGWPNIDQESLAGLEKTDTVIELLRHLPYIERSDEFNTDVAFSTRAIDYRELATFKIARGERHHYIPEGNVEYPPHVVVLTEEGEEHYGSVLLFDTEEGWCKSLQSLLGRPFYLTIILVGTAIDDQPQAPRSVGVPDPETAPLPMWRYSNTLPVAEMLASWEQNFRSLEWTVDPFNADGGMMLRWNRETDVRLLPGLFV